MQPLHLEHVLPHLPLLRQLGLSCMRLPDGVRYASKSLRCIVVGTLSPGIVECLARGQFPALASVLVEEDMNLRSLEGLTDHEKLDQAGLFAKAAAAMPLKLCNAKVFTVCGWYSSPLPDEEASEPWSSEFCACLSLELEPLSGVLTSVHELHLSSWDVTSRHSVAVLSNLMVNVQDLSVCVGCYEDVTPVLWAIVQGMPSLKSMEWRSLAYCSDHQLKSFFSACAQEGRHFLLRVKSQDGFSSSTWSLKEAVEGEWLCAKEVCDENFKVELIVLDPLPGGTPA